MLGRNILLRTEIQIHNVQGEAAEGATIEQQASAKPEPKLISIRDSQSQALPQSFPGAEHLAKLKFVGESQPSSSVVVIVVIVIFVTSSSLSSSSSMSLSSLLPVAIVVVVSCRAAAHGAIAVSVVVVVAIVVVVIISDFIARRAVAIDVVVIVARCHRCRCRIPWVTRGIITLVY